MNMPCSCSQHAAKRLGAAYISANIADILHQHLQAAEKETRILVCDLHSRLGVAVEHLFCMANSPKVEGTCKSQIPLQQAAVKTMCADLGRCHLPGHVAPTVTA